jgi:hypothetical protein
MTLAQSAAHGRSHTMSGGLRRAGAPPEGEQISGVRGSRFRSGRSVASAASSRRSSLPKPAFDHEEYRQRNIVERVIGWLKNLRRIACRAEKLAVRYAGTATLALIARTATGLLDIT